MARKRQDPVRASEVTTRLTSTGRVSGFQIEVWHDGLNEHRVLSDRDRGVLENKLSAHLARWAEKYAKRLAREEREARREAGKAAAETETAEAEEALEACRNILGHTLGIDDRVDWESLKSHAPMTRKPKQTAGIEYDQETGRPRGFRPADRPTHPAPTYTPPQLNIFDRIFSSKRKGKEAAARTAFERALKKWQDASAKASDKADRADAERQKIFDSEQQDWETEEANYKNRQDAANAEVDAFRRSYEQWDGGNSRPIEEHAELVLNDSEYPDWMDIDFDLGFNVDTKIIVVEYRLPQKDSMPTVKSVTYVQNRDERKETHISDREKDTLYEDVLHQIALRTIHELYEADDIAALDAIVFNGWVESIDQQQGSAARAASCQYRHYERNFSR